MTVSSGLRALSAVVEDLEASGLEVGDLGGDEGTLLDANALVADVGVVVPVLSGIDVPPGVEITPTSSTVDEDGRVRVDLQVSVSIDADGLEADDGEAGTSPATDEDRPPADAGPRDDGAAPDGDETRNEDGSPNGAGAPNGADARPADERPERSGTSTDVAVGEGEDDPVGEANGWNRGVDEGEDDGRDEDTPAHRDPARLAAAYEAHDTFAEMTEALGVDVTPQAVRNQMINHGIHEPESRDTRVPDEEGTASTPGASGGSEAGDSEVSPDSDISGAEGPALDTETGEEAEDDATVGEESPDGSSSAGRSETEADGDDDVRGQETTLADGIDLPEAVSLGDLKRIVASARTLHDVSRELGVDRERARRLLSELDLLDLVSGRLVAEREVSMEEIEERIEGASPAGA